MSIRVLIVAWVVLFALVGWLVVGDPKAAVVAVLAWSGGWVSDELTRRRGEPL